MAERTYDRKSTEFGEHRGFVFKLARKYLVRVHAARLPMDMDDVIGELSVAFVNAGNGYKPESGYGFTTYFGMCAQNHMNKVLGKMSREQYGEDVPDEDCVQGERSNKFGLGLLSINDLQVEGGGDPLDYLFPDDSMTVEDRMDAVSVVTGILSDNTLSPETRAYIGMLVNPSMVSEAAMQRIEARRHIVSSEIKERWGVSIRSL